MHKLLSRQLNKFGLKAEGNPEWVCFLEAVSSAYSDFENDHVLIERSLELASKEMQERYEDLRFKTTILQGMGKVESIGTMRQNASGVPEWSDETFKILGLDKSKVKPSKELLIEAIHPDDRAEFTETLQELDHVDEMEVEFRVKTPEGKDRYCFLFCELQKEISQRTDQRLMQAIIVDITAKKMGETLRIERDAALKANETKSIFLANMSHEIRTPMHGILSYARFGLQRCEQSSKEKLKSYFEEIYGSSMRLMKLLDEILDLSRLEAGKVSYMMKETNLVSLASSVCSQMSLFAKEKGLDIKVLSEEEDVPAVLDATRIGQVLSNLVSNAIKFSTKGTVEIRIDSEDGEVTCRVMNQGVGIPQNELDQIFEKFVQSSKTKTGAGGTGLGLAICREIIKDHEGKIWAESDKSGETCFTFSLPRKMKVKVPS